MTGMETTLIANEVTQQQKFDFDVKQYEENKRFRCLELAFQMNSKFNNNVVIDDAKKLLDFVENYKVTKVEQMGSYKIPISDSGKYKMNQDGTITHIAYNLKMYEFKTVNIFLVEFPEQFGIDGMFIQKINKPKCTNNKWETIKVEFTDPIAPSIIHGLYNIVNFLKSNESDSKSLFEIKVKTTDPTGVPVEEWIIQVEKVLTINFGELDYESNKFQEPYLVLLPLNCILNY